MLRIKESQEKFNILEKTFQPWLNEFAHSEAADALSSYQRENSGKMVRQLLSGMANVDTPHEDWTPNEIIKAIVEYVCKNNPEEPPYFDNYPFVMAAFFSFLEEKGHFPKGDRVAETILKAKEDIRQTDEARKKILLTYEIIQEAIDKGVVGGSKEYICTKDFGSPLPQF